MTQPQFTLIFVGPPGSGKGTQSEMIAKHLGWPHYDLGETLRARSRMGDKLGLELKTKMERGLILSSQIVATILEEAIAHHPAQSGIIIDGYARRKANVDHLLKIVREGKLPPLLVIRIELDSKYIVDRLARRRYCSECRHKTYLVLDTEEAVSCLRCGGHLVKRDDDLVETVKQRLVSFARLTVPAINYLSEHAPTVTVDGHGTIDEVNERIEQAITPYGLN